MDTRDVKTGILHKCKIQSRNVRQINGLHFVFCYSEIVKKDRVIFMKNSRKKDRFIRSKNHDNFRSA